MNLKRCLALLLLIFAVGSLAACEKDSLDDSNEQSSTSSLLPNHLMVERA